MQTPANALSSRGRTLRKALGQWQLHVLILLPVIYIAIFHYWPMYGAQIAFKRFSPGKGILGSPWIGFDNFAKFFRSFYLGRLLRNTLLISFYGLIFSFPARLSKYRSTFSGSKAAPE